MSGIIKPGDSNFPANVFGLITSFTAESSIDDFAYIEFEGIASGSEFLEDMVSHMFHGSRFPYYHEEFLCLHCGSPQSIKLTHCGQCGAPRSFIVG